MNNKGMVAAPSHPDGNDAWGSEEIFRALVEWAPEAIFFQDIDRGEWIVTNASAERLFGCPRKELLARGPLSFYTPQQPDGVPSEESIRSNIEEALDGKPVFCERAIRNAQGKDLLFEVHIVRLPYAGRRVLRASYHDITERKRAEEEIYRLNRLYAVLSQVNQAVIRSNSKQELLDGICKIAIEFGAFKMAWVGMIDEATHEVIPVASAGASEQYLSHIKVYADDRPEGRGPVGLSIWGGHPYVCNDFARDPVTLPWREAAAAVGFNGIISLPIRNGGKICGALSVYAGELNFFQAKEVKLLEEVASDISFALDHLDQETHRRQTEGELKASKEAAEAANRAKDQFIAVLSHELRTPLTPALATVSLLQSREDLAQEVRDEMAVIHRNITLEARLIDDLLDITRISRGLIELQREVVDIHASLLKTLEICQSDTIPKRITVALDLRAEHCFVWADAARMQQVFWNLIKNAVKFTPEGGQIALHTSNIGNRLKIEIADTGIGIEPEVLPRIFNPFEQGEQTRSRHFGGLGLGLSIAKNVVDLHKGRISAFSEGHGHGSVFTVELEVIDRVCKEAAKRSASVSNKVNCRILLVEDHADTLQILARLLTQWGYHVETANCFKKAIDLAASTSFDLLVSDLGLPDGSGLDIMRETKARYGLRGIALSGFGTDDDFRRSRAAGFEEHLTKPVGLEVLRAAVERLASAKSV
jgi:PAS domain S-box-containing protein